MIVNNSLDEVKKRDNALTIIKNLVETKGRSSLFDLTGLAGGFIASSSEISLLETYVGPAIFEDAIQEVGKEHMGGEKVLAVNRTSSGILATILSLVSKDSNVVHYLAELPAHPSIPRSCNLVGANYFETDVFEEFSIPNNTSLVVITGSTMDHKVIDEEEFKQIIEMAHAKDIPVMVDDASGARLRTVVFNQAKACDLGADIAITSTDKLMPGPRGGLMSGRAELIDEIKIKVNQFGLEAQPPAVLAMVNGIKNFKEENLIKSFKRKDELYKLLSLKFSNFKKSPTGVMIYPEGLSSEINVPHKLSDDDLAYVFSFILLRDYGIITIPPVSMPGASATIRFELSSSDAVNLDLNSLGKKIVSAFEKLQDIITNEEKCREIVFNS
ncbi:L-seryl-tRNA(Ser) seleniumtransferase [Methanobrevibacter gottschalkii]|uniref:L-seryl-tRNA(Ser) seleniumtransferase n=2 Tax=Methanobrevibacter gottschalkii TaxID=190974 RepID=A0A3N5B2M0_9EURY|nr:MULTISPECIES: TIGR03576 family pyridoxal phosphate-dependent enzyme [Methanobrevibacter]MCQ2970717.1 TIGR03576 family pyridoxal phosphate-dependent enzyme [archaeon]OEC97071.1 pyridoxal phosphate-dependent protein [Methanobrevibacter sp. A27]RPF51614.1 L-seryl-tRNA(Ser) seleniumtransferase [Methanobrevibacter gottschalkii DSM 11977]SEL25560.1 L-seryl-tRNA(Ser) seleniumtransferase [Methanobrevibacter gottschalkii]